MIVSPISEIQRYTPLSEGLAIAIDWLKNFSADQFVKGIIEIGKTANGTVIAKCEECSLIPRERAQLEAHKKFIDIHVPLKCTETIGWAPVSSMKHVREEYDEEKDIAFFGDTAHSLIHVKVGQCAIFFPEDAHAPNIGLGNHRKICIKIPV